MPGNDPRRCSAALATAGDNAPSLGDCCYPCCVLKRRRNSSESVAVEMGQLGETNHLKNWNADSMPSIRVERIVVSSPLQPHMWPACSWPRSASWRHSLEAASSGPGQASSLSLSSRLSERDGGSKVDMSRKVRTMHVSLSKQREPKVWALIVITRVAVGSAGRKSEKPGCSASAPLEPGFFKSLRGRLWPQAKACDSSLSSPDLFWPHLRSLWFCSDVDAISSIVAMETVYMRIR